jgi:hypothetical protein
MKYVDPSPSRTTEGGSGIPVAATNDTARRSVNLKRAWMPAGILIAHFEDPQIVADSGNPVDRTTRALLSCRDKATDRRHRRRGQRLTTYTVSPTVKHKKSPGRSLKRPEQAKTKSQPTVDTNERATLSHDQETSLALL